MPEASLPSQKNAFSQTLHRGWLMESLRIKEKNLSGSSSREERPHILHIPGRGRFPLDPKGGPDSLCISNSNNDRHFCEIRKYRIRSHIILFLFIMFYRGKIYFSYKLILYKYNCTLFVM